MSSGEGASEAASRPAARRAWYGLLLALGAAITFSGKAIIIKLGYRYGVDSVTLLMYRMLFALPLFAWMAWRAGRGRPRLSGRDLGLVGALGFVFYASAFLNFLGLNYISANLERLIMYLLPTVVLLVGFVLFGRTVSRLQVLALVLSYSGVLLVFGHELQIQGSHVGLGTLMIFTCVVAYAVYMVGSAELLKRLGPMRVSGWTSTVACLLCIGQFLLMRPLSAAAVPTSVLWLSLANGLVCTAAPGLLLMMAMERLGAGVTAQVGMVGPMSTILMSVLILGEPFTVWVAAGTALVMGGVWMLTRERSAGAANA
ncbi:MAG: DMT family transporter [Burkholderiales bacterium]